MNLRILRLDARLFHARLLSLDLAIHQFTADEFVTIYAFVDLLLLWFLDLLVTHPSLKVGFVKWVLNIYKVVIIKKIIINGSEALVLAAHEGGSCRPKEQEKNKRWSE
jgi:hypothetical protein